MASARRGFLKALAVVPLAPGALATQAASKPAVAAKPAAPPAAATKPSDSLADALTEAVRLEHGAHLDGDDLARIRKQVARDLDRGERLRKAVSLRNGDEPVTLFEAVPPEADARRRR